MNTGIVLLGSLLLPTLLMAQTSRYPLTSTAELRSHNVVVEPATLQGEAEIAGDVRPGAPEGARGFVGIAFRVQADLKTYDAFYLRPTNGRADDQVRRNHSAQ